MEEVLKKITEFADKAHGAQMRKYTPERYIVHPIRVMELCRQYTNDVTILAAALLHDVLEDTPVTAEDLKIFLGSVMSSKDAERTVALVKELTDEFIKSDYPKFNRRKRKAMEVDRLLKTSADSQSIKYADIYDNCIEIVKHDPHFAKVFLSECKNILTKLDKGEPHLLSKARQIVDKGIQQLKEKNNNSDSKTQKTS
jgi:guanosine-3',5'-bis(diphosphate) 3'-pyrophosphohydrolase